MFHSLVLKRETAWVKAVTAVFGMAMCVILPQLCHLTGGSGLGMILMPMYLPVLFVGLFSGCTAGLVCGVLSPVLSFWLTGMPAPGLLPFMMIELAAFGLAAGAFSKAKMPAVLKVLLSQVIGRGVRVAAVLAAVYAFGAQFGMVQQTLHMLVQGLPGMLIQLLLLPVILNRLEKLA